MAQDNAMTGQDIREGMRLAAKDMDGVGDEISRLASESRLKILQGDERKKFFEGMTQDEFDTLHSIAMAGGSNGMTALERLMNEAKDQWNESRKAQ